MKWPARIQTRYRLTWLPVLGRPAWLAAGHVFRGHPEWTSPRPGLVPRIVLRDPEGRPAVAMSPAYVEAIHCRILTTNNGREIAVLLDRPSAQPTPPPTIRDGVHVEVFVDGVPAGKLRVEADFARIRRPGALQLLRDAGVVW